MKAIHEKQVITTIKKLLRTNKKIVVIYRGHNNDLRRREIYRTGMCRTSYRGAYYSRWSRYYPSCFFYDYINKIENRKNIRQPFMRSVREYATLSKTLKAMQNHDEFGGETIGPIQINYGKNLEKHIFVVNVIK